MAGVVSVVALVAIVLLATSAGGSSGGYTVRAIFDDAANIIPGENVKVDGVNVGKVTAVEPTPKAQAAVTIAVENPGFQDFRSDASCTIRPQALIGEKFVDCLPTQPRVEGTPLPPPLKVIPHGEEGAGDRLLPVTDTHSPVDVDLLQDITRRPESERLAIIINELGAGLAGRGSDLNEVVRRANPALQELGKVLSILAGENHVLAKLATDSDKALAPFAAVRNRVADFVVQAGTVSRATAEHSAALKRNLADFPAFLRQLGPAMERLGRFADQTAPAFANLGIAAPGLNKAFTHLGAFSDSSTKFFTTFGQTAQSAGPAIAATQPLLKRVQALGVTGKPFSSSLAELLSSLRSTGGLERFMDFVFLGSGSLNGYDSLGHFLRGEGLVKACVTYVITPAPGCTAKLFSTTGSEAKTASAGKPDPATTSLVMARTLAVLDGSTPAQALAKYPGSAPSAGEITGTGSPSGTSAAGGGAAQSANPVGGSSAGTTYYTPAAEGAEAGGMLLNYLLGN